MRLVILDDYDQTSEWAAKYVRNRILEFNPGPDRYFVMGLPTGLLFMLQNSVFPFKVYTKKYFVAQQARSMLN